MDASNVDRVRMCGRLDKIMTDLEELKFSHIGKRYKELFMANYFRFIPGIVRTSVRFRILEGRSNEI